MNPPDPWQYNEYKQIGKDYTRPEEVEIYDTSHADFRNAEEESHNIVAKLGLKPSDHLIDFGCGTGIFSVIAARQCRKVYAVDVSETMLDYARKRARRANVTNIVFSHSGFLTYKHGERPVDAVVSSLSLHHLPDFWKGIALRRIHEMLKPGGRFYLYDVILDEEHPLGDIRAFVDQQARAGGEFLQKDAEEHFREEFSTYNWIMEGLLERAGFAIRNRTTEENAVMVCYLCEKPL